MTSRDVSGERDRATSVDCKEEVRLKDCRQCCGNEAPDSKGNQTVGKHLRRRSVVVARIFSGVIDEEAGDGDLGADIAELGDGAEDHVVLLVERTVADDISVLIDTL